MINMTINDKRCTLTLDRPKANALSAELVAQLGEKLDTVEADGTVKVVLLQGEGRFFSAGADIKEFALRSAEELEQQSRDTHAVFNRLEHFNVPVIALIKGAALGGGLELAMSCHIRLSTVDAQLGLPEINLGVMPGYSGIRRLKSHVGTAKALEMALTGQAVSGAEAEVMGLVTKAFPTEDDMVRYAEQLSSTIQGYSLDSIQGIMAVSAETEAEKSDDTEARLFGRIFDTDNAKEGVQAFIAKRRPDFK
ncbi:enoyl-CoA hydratase [Macrococcus equipercicus]|uniref:Enoyl-CoA hydratase n=1 Tax=Macrococcus equipercicus TaxID=69967 RepID=A0ABQ6R9I4_9STAP|nr:enoyl-CoA hydratase-related protein [Macrococcus equipercicus]KAA1039967.1 enoyl-CoA hydratase [Macrococcus equipercicus]